MLGDVQRSEIWEQRDLWVMTTGLGAYLVQIGPSADLNPENPHGRQAPKLPQPPLESINPKRPDPWCSSLVSILEPILGFISSDGEFHQRGAAN